MRIKFSKLQVATIRCEMHIIFLQLSECYVFNFAINLACYRSHIIAVFVKMAFSNEDKILIKKISCFTYTNRY